ncbi:sodium-dependent multivitamin transporter-like [Anneissia japonica]|uniref:sodium-dependent multivitamin transporter-like n=1 Tax=Anneissia japonica TaxID=1529436 RepID=UPI0014256FAE|nr:sodium-dependent multivitamin transporter-like [Anneissia japonica]
MKSNFSLFVGVLVVGAFIFLVLTSKSGADERNVKSIKAMDNTDGRGNVHAFGVLDYIIFSAMLVVSAATGLYHAFADSGQNTTARFLMADRSMFSLPVAISLLASFCSAITILGIPAEVFKHGVQYWMVVWSYFLVLPITAIVFIPVFYDLQLTSAYEYLDRRFSMLIRVLGASLFILQTVFYMAVVLYAPALALEVVTSLEVWKTVLMTGIVCTFYTSLGGIKAVIWTDVFQFLVLFGSLVVVIVLGTNRAGGLEHVWTYNKEHGQLNFFVPDTNPLMRLNIWSVVIGGTFTALPIWAVSQTAVQRFLTAKDLKGAQRSIWYSLPGNIIMISIVAFCGLVLYAFYDGTTPGKQVPNYSSVDQILIYFVSQEFGTIPGIQGLFVACLFAGTLSTVASGLNSLAAVTLVDIVKPVRSIRNKDGGLTSAIQDRRDTLLSKVMTCGYGILSILLAYVASQLDGLIQTANTVIGTAGGPLLGLFSLGMLYRRANSGGALIGLLSGFLLALWITIGAIVHTDGGEVSADAFSLYHLSFLWYSTASFFTTFFIGIATSEIVRCAFVDEERKSVDLLTMARFLRPKGWKPPSAGSTSLGLGIDDSSSEQLLAHDDDDDDDEDEVNAVGGSATDDKHLWHSMERSTYLKKESEH